MLVDVICNPPGLEQSAHIHLPCLMTTNDVHSPFQMLVGSGPIEKPSAAKRLGRMCRKVVRKVDVHQTYVQKFQRRGLWATLPLRKPPLWTVCFVMSPVFSSLPSHPKTPSPCRVRHNLRSSREERAEKVPEAVQSFHVMRVFKYWLLVTVIPGFKIIPARSNAVDSSFS